MQVLFFVVLVRLGRSCAGARLRQDGLGAGSSAEEMEHLSFDLVSTASATSASLSSLNSTWKDGRQEEERKMEGTKEEGWDEGAVRFYR